MSKYSISKSIILGYGWTNFEVLKMSNSYNLECANNNKKLIPFCSINPNFGKKSNDELERCILLVLGELAKFTQLFKFRMKPF